MRRLESRARRRLRENQVPAGRLTPLGTALILGVSDLWEAKPKQGDTAWFCRTALSTLERLDRAEEAIAERERAKRERDRKLEKLERNIDEVFAMLFRVEEATRK